MFITFLICIVLAYYGYKIMINRKYGNLWYDGFFENEESHFYHQDIGSKDRLLEAYISLSALMIRKDRTDYNEKLRYLNNYFAKHFPRSHYNFGDSFIASLKNPIYIKDLSKWLRKRLPHREDRLQILYFLAGIATVDGSLNRKEIDLLRDMNELLELSPKDFESIISMYNQRQQREREQRAENSKPRVSVIQLACKVLGVSEHASMDEIKKAYRSLVKLHHPDRFATQGLDQQKIAETRFVEIQKAYEVLERK